MSDFVESGIGEGKKGPRRFHITFHILIFAILVTATFLGLRPLWAAMQFRMGEFRDGLIRMAEDYTGRRIEYASMGPSLLGGLDIRNIRVYGAGGMDGGAGGMDGGAGSMDGGADDETVLSLSRLRISWSLRELIQKKPEAIRAIRIDRPLVNFDFERDRDLLDLFLSREPKNRASARSIAEWIPQDVLFRIRNGKFIITKGGVFSLDRVNFDASVKNGRIAVQGKWSAAASLPESGGFLRNLVMPGRLSGSIGDDFKDGNVLVTFPFIAGDYFRTSSFGLGISLRDNRVEVRKTNDRSPLDLSMDYDLSSRHMRAFFRCEDFTPGDLVSFSGDWKSINSWLAIRGAGEASFEMDSSGKIGYTADLSGAIPKNLPMAGFSFAIKAGGDEEYVRFDRLSLKIKRGDINFQGGIGLKPFAPNGTLSVSDFSLAKQGEEVLNADLSVTTEGREISIFGETIRVGDVDLSALDLSLRRETEGYTFAASALRFRDMESYEQVSLSSLSLDGAFDDKNSQIEARFLLDSFSAADLSSMLKPFAMEPELPPRAEDISNDISITTEIFISTDFKHVSYNVPRLLIAYEGGRDIIGLFSVSGTDRRFELSDGQLIWADNAFRFTGRADFSNPMDLTFSLSANFRDMSYQFAGVFLDRRELSIQGSYGLQAAISAAGTGGYSGYIVANDIPIPFRGQVARLRLSTSLRYNSPTFWSFDINRIELTGLATPGSPASLLRISGNADQNGAGLDEFFFDDGRGALTGRANLFWNRDYTDIRGQLNISNDMGTELYTAEASWETRHLNLSLFGTGMQLARFVDNARGAIANGDIRFSWNSIDSYYADINLTSLTARNQNTDVEASVSAHLDNEEFFLTGLHLSYGNIEADIPALRVNRKDARAEARGRIRGTAAGRNIDISFGADSEFKPVDSWFNLPQVLDSLEGTLNLGHIRFDTKESYDPFVFVFSRDRDILSLTGGPNDMIRFRLSDAGDFYAGFSNPSPIRGSVIGSITRDTIDAQAQDIYIDFPALWAFIPSNRNITMVGGYATASVQIRGPLGDPEFFGTAHGQSIRLRVPRFLDQDIRPVPITVTIEGNEMTFDPLPAAVGDGMGMVSGWFRFDRWIPNIFSLDIEVPQDAPIPFKFDLSGVLAEGIVSGTMNIAMEDRTLSVTGDLIPEQTDISLDFAERAALARQQDTNIRRIPTVVDIGVTAGKKIQFLWPDRKFPILQAYADTGAQVRITSDTLTQRFSFIGDVKLRNGELFYFERSFYIRNGMISFNEDEQSFDPRLTVRAETRDRSSEGPVTIAMVVDNAPLRSFTARFESTPALSQMEINSLLGQSITGAGEGGSVNNAFMLVAGADILGQFPIFRRWQRVVRDFLRLDMLSFRTQVVQNAVFQLTGLQDPVDRNNVVGNYFDNTSFSIGKYVGSDMFIQGGVSARYDANKVELGGYTFEPDFGIDLQSPLGNFRWNLSPVHPESWFISDVSFTWTWTMSF
ncbi:hypothetical protein FACS1894110_00080 [Spirochaetia bacterium]|nr:hypothetical protein FACS1894110_00080 [Spirochaetia bacterium]